MSGGPSVPTTSSTPAGGGTDEPLHKTSQSLLIQVGSDLKLWSEFDEETGYHYLYCDLCGYRVYAGNGRGMNMVNHRWSENCKQLQWKRKNIGKYTTPIMSHSRRAVPPPPKRAHHFPCRGAPYVWQLGSFWNTYPFQEHVTDSLGWLPCEYDRKLKTVYLRADSCSRKSTIPDSPCTPCERVVTSIAFSKMLYRAAHGKRHTPYHLLSHSQLEALIRYHVDDKNRIRNKLAALQRRFQVARTRIQDHERIMMFLAKEDIQRLRWVLSTTLRAGAGPKRVLTMLQLAAEGLYRARVTEFDQRLVDLSLLSSYSGGERMHVALSRGLGLLSTRTLQRHAAVPCLTASVSSPAKGEVNHNISAFLQAGIKPVTDLESSPAPPGHVLMIDGVSLESRARYDPKRDLVLGLARETIGTLDTSASTIENVDKIRSAIEDGTVQFGSEATVVAIAPYAEPVYYSPVPLVSSPSNKTEKAPALATWVAEVVQAWNEHTSGGLARGRIWSIASDGDSSYRRAKHMLCVVKELGIDSPLGTKLVPLRGFNRFVSADGERSATCDPKHVFKRFATLMRSSDGIMLFETNIRPQDIITVLRVFTNMSYADARELLDPADKQNVPKAVTLLQSLQELNNRPVVSALPGEAKKRSAVLFFSDFLWFFAAPFIVVEMDLQSQLESLSAFSHAAVMLYREHGNACLTSALFYDAQAIVKNVFIIVARLQLISPDLCFWLLLEGTDRLEQVFSEVRTLDHARNFDISQLSSKLGVSCLIHSVYQRNPDLDRGHRRLNAAKSMGIDHLNPRSWVGSVRVGDVDLQRAWNAGREKAISRFRAAFGSSFTYDFDSLFSAAHHDVLRPQGVYVGVDESTLLDLHREKRSERIEPECTTSIELSDPDTPDPAEPLPFAAFAKAPIIDDGDDEAADADAPRRDVLSTELETVALPDGLDVDDYFPDTVDGEIPDSAPSQTPAKPPPTFSNAEGQTFYKSTYVSGLSDPAHSKKLTTRTLRAAGRTLQDFHRSKIVSIGNTNLDDAGTIKSGDIMCFLARVAAAYALAILEVTAFRMPWDDVRVSITPSDLDEHAKNPRMMVIGQILCVRELEPSRWVWTGKYMSLDGASDVHVSHARYVIEVPAAVAFVMAPRLSNVQSSGPGGSTTTWMFEEAELTRMCSEAWAALNPETEEILSNTQLLPVIRNQDDLPMRSQNVSITVQSIPSHLVPKVKLQAKDTVKCRLCGAECYLSKMRSHVGKHILLALRKVTDTGCAKIKPNPCGFCGLEGCATVLTFRKKNTLHIASSCEYHYEKMNYYAAMTSTKSTPSTNVPIQCPLCPLSVSGHQRTIWKYNALFHYATMHSDDENHAQGALMKFLIATHVRQAEDAAMGIPEESTKRFREIAKLPDSDTVEGYIKNLAKMSGLNKS